MEPMAQPGVDLNLLVLYGSQTGTAADIARYFYRLVKWANVKAEVMAFDEFNILSLPAQKNIIFFVSTTGDGEVPDNMKKNWAFLLRKSLPPNSLSDVNFAVFGLGDSSYSKFNAVARRLHVRFEQLGAKPIIEKCLGDDQFSTGIWGCFYAWLTKLWEKFDELFPHLKIIDAVSTYDFLRDEPKYQVQIISQENESSKETIEYMDVSDYSFHALRVLTEFDSVTLKIPNEAIVKENIRLTSESWTQEVRHIEFTTDTSNHRIRAGDIALIQPQNNEENVQKILSYFGLKQNDLIEINRLDGKLNDLPSRCSLGDLFRCHLDISASPTCSFFCYASGFASNEEEKSKLKELSSPEGIDLFYEQCIREKRTFVEIFREMQSLRPPLHRLLELIPRLQPRQFSIASSPIALPNEIHICVAVVNFITPYGRKRKGICSTWLSQLQIGQKIAMWFKEGSFHAPTDLANPLLMIGPGTGVAPFRAMIQERETFRSMESEKIDDWGNDVLIFGCRKSEHDFLYKIEWEHRKSQKYFRFISAFSRDQPEKIYVTHQIQKNSSLIWQMLSHPKIVCFIAGSAKNMPLDVFNALIEVVMTEGGYEYQEAQGFMIRMQKQKRYCVEAWT